MIVATIIIFKQRFCSFFTSSWYLGQPLADGQSWSVSVLLVLLLVLEVLLLLMMMLLLLFLFFILLSDSQNMTCSIISGICDPQPVVPWRAHLEHCSSSQVKNNQIKILTLFPIHCHLQRGRRLPDIDHQLRQRPPWHHHPCHTLSKPQVLIIPIMMFVEISLWSSRQWWLMTIMAFFLIRNH